jgi:tetratricopeptide (TPR) repeat protein
VTLLVVLSLLAFQAPQLPAVADWVERTRAMIRAGRTSEALLEVRRILKAYPGNPEAQFEAGALLQDLAGSTFQRMQQLAPDSAETHQLLGKYYEARGRLPEALGEYRRALGAKGSAPGLHFLIGNVLWKNRDFEAALPEFEAELRVNPGHSKANQRAGNIYIHLDQPERALPYLEKAVAGEPTLLEARRDLGKAYRHVGRLDEAIRQLQIVLEQSPQDESAHAQLAAVYRAKGDLARAAEELKLLRELLKKRSEAAERKDRQ